MGLVVLFRLTAALRINTKVQFNAKILIILKSANEFQTWT